MLNFFKKDQDKFAPGISTMVEHHEYDPQSGDYDNFVQSFVDSWNANSKYDDDHNKKDPMKSLYNTALDMTQKQISGDKDKKGDWETTEMIDQNFANLVEAAKNNDNFKNTFNDVNLDDYNNEWFKSAGQKYRDKYIKPESGENLFSDMGNAIKGLEYNMAKPIGWAIDNSQNVPILKGLELNKNISTDDVMPVFSGATDALASIGGAAAGAAAGSVGGGIGAVPGAVLGGATAPFVKDFIEFSPERIKGQSKIDPVTGNEIDDNQAGDLQAEGWLIPSLAALTGGAGAGGLAGLAKAPLLNKGIDAIANNSFVKGAIEKIPQGIKNLPNAAEQIGNKIQDKKIIGPIANIAKNISSNWVGNIPSVLSNSAATPVYIESVLKGAASPLAKRLGIMKNVEPFTSTAKTGFLSGLNRGLKHDVDEKTDQDVYLNPDYYKRKTANPYQLKEKGAPWITERLTYGRSH